MQFGWSEGGLTFVAELLLFLRFGFRMLFYQCPVSNLQYVRPLTYILILILLQCCQVATSGTVHVVPVPL